MVVAGGTDLFPNMKRRQQEPPVVIGLRAVKDVHGVTQSEDGWVRIGAMTTLAEAESNPILKERYPAFATAARLVSTPHLRLMGTVGGNLCLDTRCTYYDQGHQWRKAIDFCMKAPETNDSAICWVAPNSPRCWAVSSSDTAPVAVALGAKFRLVSKAEGERMVDAEAFFNDDGMRYLTKRPDEILAEVHLPPMEGYRTTYLKLRRRDSFDFPVLGVAAAASMDGEVVKDVRLVLGAVGSAPYNATSFALALVGNKPTVEAIDAVAAGAYKGARPLDNTDLNYAWRKKMARVYVRRALAEVLGVQLPAPVQTGSTNGAAE
jgi:4-hydroxybenzoyl-CoA reductase subunit beta